MQMLIQVQYLGYYLMVSLEIESKYHAGWKGHLEVV